MQAEELHAARAPGDPFEAWPHPTAAQCADVVERLAAMHGMPRRPRAEAKGHNPAETRACGSVPTILDALVRTILSQNTTNRNSSRAMQNFVERFGGDYEAVRQASLAAVSESIACGGLAHVKGRRIKNIVDSLHAALGEVTLEHLRPLPDAEIKEALMRFDGVGPKTASCVLLFCLRRDSFAVDTHVFRIAKKLGWVPAKATREQTHLHLDARVPPSLMYALHVLLIRHGKSCYACAANGRPQQQPRGPCPLQL